jgi:hypothetical protein
VLAKRYAHDADILLFERTATPAPLRSGTSRLGEREAYIVAGSFVRFLIADFGLAKFRELYAQTPLVPGQRDAGKLGRWAAAYGLTIDELVVKWRRAIGGS